MLKSNTLLIGNSERKRKGNISQIDTKGFPELKACDMFSQCIYLKGKL